MGIKHIEDLAAEEFLSVLSNLDKFHLTEKVDGLNLTVGADESGMFVSREGKGGKRYYHESDFGCHPADFVFRNAFVALSTSAVGELLSPGELIDCEVLCGRQPNAIVYGINAVVFLHNIRGNFDFNLLHSIPDVMCETIHVTSDGHTLVHHPKKEFWEFLPVPVISASEMLADIDISNNIQEFRNWLETREDGMVTSELLRLKLNQVKLDEREFYRAKRDTAREMCLKRKLQIKELLLVALRDAKPVLQQCSVDPHEQIGIEGVVLTEQSSGNHIKIVDKDTFTKVNTFNHLYRGYFQSSIALLYGAFASIHGISKLQHNPKHNLKPYLGSSLEDSVANIASNFKHKNLKGSLLRVINEAIDDLKAYLGDYDMSVDKLEQEIRSGIRIRYTPEIQNRTMIAYCVSMQELYTMRREVEKSQTPQDIALALYRKQLSSLH